MAYVCPSDLWPLYDCTQYEKASGFGSQTNPGSDTNRDEEVEAVALEKKQDIQQDLSSEALVLLLSKEGAVVTGSHERLLSRAKVLGLIK